MPIILGSSIQNSSGGSPTEALLGNSAHIPRGVEAVFEFNGLVMNDRSLIDTYLLLNIDGLYDADIRDVREVNPQSHGETPFEAFYGGRTIAIQGRVRAHTIKKLRNMCEGLQVAFVELTEKPLRFVSNFSKYQGEVYCRKAAAITLAETQQSNNFTRDFLLTLRASDPRIMSTNTIVANSASPVNTPIVVANEGTFFALPRITITGPVTNARLRNLTTDFQMQINGDIAAGDTYFIDTANRTIENQNHESKFSQLDISSDWLDLVPGTNTIELENGLSTNQETTFSLTYNHTWI